MRAFLATAYGSPAVLALAEVPTPTIKDDEVLVRIRATSVTSGDARMRAFNVPKGFRLIGRLVMGISKLRQPILGAEMAGDVVAVGKAVTRFAVGDRVFGLPVTGCHADYRAVRATGPIARIPDGVSYEDAAALPFGATTALSFLTRSKLQRGDTLLVNGASGAVGVATLQVARSMGIATVAVCSASNHELVLSLGATRAIDYREAPLFSAGDAYDGVMDTVGNLSLAAVAPFLRAKGTFLGVVGMPGPGDMPHQMRGKRVVGGMAVGSAALMEEVARLAAAGSLKAVIGQRFGFKDLPAAHAYVDSGHKVGTAVVTVA